MLVLRRRAEHAQPERSEARAGEQGSEPFSPRRQVATRQRQAEHEEADAARGDRLDE